MAFAETMTIRDTLDEFTGLVSEAADRMGGPLPLARAASDRSAPASGVYFFIDPSERNQNGGSRIVRVGTHALTRGSSSTLRGRLAQHRGTISTALGNHRGSIFRLLVGQALISAGKVRPCPSWGVGGMRSAAARRLLQSEDQIAEAEAPVERTVTEYLRGLEVVWLGIDDEPGPESMRGVVERGSIALLAEAFRSGHISAGPDWLGRYSDRPAVRDSALWNQNHVYEAWSPSFLAPMRSIVARR